MVVMALAVALVQERSQKGAGGETRAVGEGQVVGWQAPTQSFRLEDLRGLHWGIEPFIAPTPSKHERVVEMATHTGCKSALNTFGSACPPLAPVACSDNTPRSN